LKSRIIVWSIVGVLVVAAVVFLLARPRLPQTPRMTAERLQKSADRTELQVNRLAARLVAARNVPPPGLDQARAIEADRLLTEARSKLGEARQSSDVKQGEALLRNVKVVLRKARRELELASKGAVVRPPNM
jgi:hypothetical protein